MAYLDAWNGQIRNYDDTDDYRSELVRLLLCWLVFFSNHKAVVSRFVYQRKIKMLQGPGFKFEYVHLFSLISSLVSIFSFPLSLSPCAQYTY